jgi:hypothetical protein
MCSFQFNHRHNILGKMVRYAGLSIDREVSCIPGSQVKPADIFIHNGPNGIPLAVDVAVVSALTSTVVDDFHDLSMCGINVNQSESKKLSKYRDALKKVKGRIGFEPFAISTFGSTGAHAKKVISFLVSNVKRTRLIPAEIAQFYITRILVSHVMQFVGLIFPKQLQSFSSMYHSWTLGYSELINNRNLKFSVDDFTIFVQPSMHQNVMT